MIAQTSVSAIPQSLRKFRIRRGGSVIILAVLSIFLFSCQGHLLSEKIKREIRNCPADSGCTIRISDLTDFPWDSMYCFKITAELSEIEGAIGAKFPDYEEFSDRLVFMKGDSITYRVDLPTDIEKVLPGRLIVEIPDSVDYVGFSRGEAVFLGKREDDYYILFRKQN